MRRCLRKLRMEGEGMPDKLRTAVELVWFGILMFALWRRAEADVAEEIKQDEREKQAASTLAEFEEMC